MLTVSCNSRLLEIIADDNAYLGSAEYTLTVRPSHGDHGTVTPGGDMSCRHGYPVDISAASVSPYKFRGWAKVEGGGDVLFGDEHNPATTIVLNGGDAVIQANFAMILPVVLTRDSLVINPGDEEYTAIASLGGSDSCTVTVTGDLLEGVAVNSVSVTGEHAGDFSASPAAALPHTLAYNETVDFTVTFEPTDVGYRYATVTIGLDDPDNPEFSFAVSGSGGEWGFETDLYAFNQALGDSFGYAVDVCDATIDGTDYEFTIAGEPGDNAGTGRALVHNSVSSWGHEFAGSTLTLNSGAQAGMAVGVMAHPDGGSNQPIMAMGVPANPGGTYPDGSVYVAERDPSGPDWRYVSIYRQWLVPLSATSGELFGSALAFAPGFIAVGAREHNYGAHTNTGAVYIFDRAGAYFGSPNGGAPGTTQRRETAIVRSPNPEANGRFGATLDAHGNWIIVGAPEENSQNGAAYIFDATQPDEPTRRWTLSDPDPDVSANDYYGSSVAIHGDFCAVGSYGYGVNLGKVSVFHWDGATWEYLQALDPLETTGSSLGLSMDMSDEFLVVGAPIEDVGANNTGSIYVYERRGDSFVFRDRIVGDPADDGDQLGFTVRISGDLIIAGMPFYDGPGSSSGRTFVYRCD